MSTTEYFRQRVQEINKEVDRLTPELKTCIEQYQIKNHPEIGKRMHELLERLRRLQTARCNYLANSGRMN